MTPAEKKELFAHLDTLERVSLEDIGSYLLANKILYDGELYDLKVEWDTHDPVKLANRLMADRYGDERLSDILGHTGYAEVIRPVITEIMKKRQPDGFDMTIRSQEEWAAIAEAVNVGIDSRLEALTRSTFDNGSVWIHPEEMGIFIDRMNDIAVAASNEMFAQDEAHHEVCSGDDCKSSIIDGLVRAILQVMMDSGEED